MINFFLKIRQQGFILILIPLLYLSVNVGYAQNSKIDSLKSIIRKDIKDTTHVNALNKLSLELIQIDSLIEANHYADEAISLADKIDYKKGKAYAYKNKGMAGYYKGEYFDAIEAWLISLEMFEAIQDNVGIANMTNNIGAVFFSNAGNARSIEFYERSLVLSKKIGDTLRITTALLNIGHVYTDIEDYENALTYFQQIKKYLSYFNDPYIESAYLEGTGDLYRGKRDHQKARSFYKDALSVNQDTMATSNIIRKIGEEESKLGNTSNAIEYLMLANETAKKTNSLFDQAESLASLGNVYKSTDQNKALKAYKEAESLAIEMEMRFVLIDIYAGLGEIYKARGDINNTYNYLKKSMAEKDTIDRIDNDSELEKEFFDFEVGRTKEEIAVLQKEAIITELSSKRQKYVIYGTVASLIVVFIVAIGVLNRYRYVKKTNKIIEEEKNRSESLLLNILPSEIAEELKLKGSADARDCDLVTVLFTDFQGFTQAAEELTAKELIDEINNCFAAFDHICDKFGIEKIKTIGDSYMAAGGIPLPSDNSVKNTVSAALEMKAFIKNRIEIKMANNEIPFKMRVGINSGPVVAGIVGVKKFQYDIWGDTVNTASRMESAGEVGKVNISQHTYELIKNDSNFAFEKRGKIQVKGKGELEMYFVRLKNVE